MVVALGVGTASAGLRGDRFGDGTRNASQQNPDGQNDWWTMNWPRRNESAMPW